MTSKRRALAGLGRLGIEPDGLTSAEAAAYYGYAKNTFLAKVRKGKLPGPIPGTNRWSKRTLDRHASGEPDKHDETHDPIMEKIRSVRRQAQAHQLVQSKR